MRRPGGRGAAIAGVLLAAAAWAATWARAEGRAPIDPAGIDRLARDSGGTARVTVHPATGAARRVRLEPGRPRLTGADPAARAGDFLRRYGRIFGIADPAAELTAPQARTDRLGTTHLRYRQIYRGLPVFAGEMRAHFGPSGRLTSVNGAFIPAIDLDPAPARTAAEAAATAVGFVGSLRQAGPAPALAAGTPTLMVFRAGLARGVDGPTHLAWEVEVGDGAGIREFVYVDAHTGKVIDRISGIHRAVSRRIHSPAFNASVIWTEGDPLPYNSGVPSNDAQVNSLIGAAKNTYDLFLNLSGGAFPSWNGADAIMHSVWNIPSTPQVPCPNAYWDGTKTNFCNGVAADDTAAHEWTHAYTERTHNLIYQWQSGALNEAYSDMFGETVDRLNGTGTDAPSPPRTAGQCSTLGGSPPPRFDVTSPQSIAGGYPAGGATYNPPPPRTVSGTLQLVNDNSATTTDACQALVGFTTGRIAVIDRGTCSFVVKTQNAQNAGASAVIIVNNQGDSVITMSGSSTTITIPSMMIGQGDGALIKAQLGSGVAATMSLDVPTDASLRWLHSEDDSGFGGAIRDMWNPNCFGDPGRVSDRQFYVCGTGDGGGVHTNSGVPNHAYALLTDGGTYNGRVVAALGVTRTAHIYWRAMDVYQVSSSDFADHADALEASCDDLIGAPLTDPATGAPSAEVITPADCAALAEAMLAVEMRTPPAFCNFQPLLNPAAPAAPCGAPIFFDDFETSPAGRWTLSNSGVNPEYTPRDWSWGPGIQPGGAGMALFALDDPALGDCVPGSDDQSGAMRLDSPPIAVPRDFPLLTFDHYVATEAGYDGGNVKISVNGGAFTTIPSAAFQFNPYNATLITAGGGNTNPLAGQPGFSGTNGGENQGSWGQSQVGLSSFAGAGDTIVLRFEFGVDGCGGVHGWYVDNVRVCSDCGGPGGADTDADGSRICDGDCDPANGATFPGAPEINDGLDNQCPGDAGAGLVDEIAGPTGFFTPGDQATYSWTAQAGATLYQVARSTTRDFSAGCAAFTSSTPSIVDPAVPTPAVGYYYLARPLLPNPGSWGRDSSGAERIGVCGL